MAQDLDPLRPFRASLEGQGHPGVSRLPEGSGSELPELPGRTSPPEPWLVIRKEGQGTKETVYLGIVRWNLARERAPVLVARARVLEYPSLFEVVLPASHLVNKPGVEYVIDCMNRDTAKGTRRPVPDLTVMVSDNYMEMLFALHVFREFDMMDDCGYLVDSEGPIAKLLEEWTVSALDVSPETLARAHEKVDAHLKMIREERLENNGYDWDILDLAIAATRMAVSEDGQIANELARWTIRQFYPATRVFGPAYWKVVARIMMLEKRLKDDKRVLRKAAAELQRAVDRDGAIAKVLETWTIEELNVPPEAFGEACQGVKAELRRMEDDCLAGMVEDESLSGLSQEIAVKYNISPSALFYRARAAIQDKETGGPD